MKSFELIHKGANKSMLQWNITKFVKTSELTCHRALHKNHRLFVRVSQAAKHRIQCHDIVRVCIPWKLFLAHLGWACNTVDGNKKIRKILRFLSNFAAQVTFFAAFLFITCRGKLLMVIENGFALCAPFLDSHVPSGHRIIGSNVAFCRQILVSGNKPWWLIKQP